MNWFKNRRMAVKLTLAFGTCVLLAGLIGAQALRGMSTLDHGTEQLAMHARGLDAIKEVNLGVVRASRAVRNALLDESDADIQKRIGDIKRYRDEYTAALGEFEKTVVTQEGRDLLAELRQLDVQQLRPAQDELLQLAVAHKVDEAKGKLKAARAVADAVDVIVDKLESTKERLMKQLMDDSAATYASTRLTMIATILVVALVAFSVAVVLTRLTTGPLQESVRVLRLVAEGDFRQALTLDTRDEMGDMARALNQAVDKVRTALDEVRGASDTVSSAAQQLASASEEISSGAQEQASSLEETAASLEEITATIKQNADNAQQASQLAEGARNSAENGGQVTGDAVTAMAAINESSKQIADIITTIDEIAFQTNLLALNAAVEAARAGEQGRGFAVVAAEVRNLAQRSASAAKEIKALIQDSVRKVEAGSELVNKSGRTLHEIVTAVKRVTDIVGEIAAASREQSGGIEQVNKAVSQMDQVTQANASQTEEMSGTAESLAGEAGKLQALVAQFKLGGERPAASLRPASSGKTVSFARRPKPTAVRTAPRVSPAVEGALALDEEFKEF